MWLLTGSVLAMERLRFKNLSEFYLLNLWLCYKLTFVILSHNNIVKTLLVFPTEPYRLYLRRFIYSELSANYISYITVYSYTYKHLHHPITSALYTPYHQRIMPIRMHSRLVIDFHNYLISLFLLTMILISP